MTRILVIEDEAPIRDALRRSLHKAGHEVIEAADGHEGLNLFHQHAPDLTLTDILMPVTDGIETIRALRRAHPEVKIVAMSGGGHSLLHHDNLLVAAQCFGAARILAKPFTPEELLEAVSTVLAS